GILYIHGYQNNCETSDAYCIELARRGFVVLNIDAIGRGNSGQPLPLDDPGFDETFGAMASFDYLQSLPYVAPDALGIMGHSVGGEIAYQLALTEPAVQAVVISGTAYTLNADYNNPPNMLMIFGRYDEYRKRMTGVSNFAGEWMDSEQTKAVIPADAPQFSVTYGSFADGTARRVFMPNITHIQESHNNETVAEALLWMRDALNPPADHWIDPHDQIWHIKEWATFAAMLAGFAALIPLGYLLLSTKLFAALRTPVQAGYAASKTDFRRGFLINGGLMLLYLPLIMVIFGFHVYVMPIDKLFPMMIVNGIAFWFIGTNVLGFLLFWRWYKRKSSEEGLTLDTLGASDAPDKFKMKDNRLWKSALLAGLLFAFAYLCQTLLEKFLIVDYRFIFPFASDLTPYRTRMFFLYLPFFLFGFIQVGYFLYGRMRRPLKATLGKTFRSWTWTAIWVMVTPLLVQLALQYVPNVLFGVVPFIGPSSALVGFIINLVHIIIVLLMLLPLSTYFFLLTGNVYTGAILNAFLVTWMFASSQVIAPIPV
ncbi:MAG TPA: alpha/beta fold hydrolase, partial [Anaerolineales bacterium]|nr:alpha/beta fold hydrolase [Anaerolineales bacterium]